MRRVCVCVAVCIRDGQLFNLIIFDDIWTEIHKYSFKRDHYLWLNAADQTNEQNTAYHKTYAISCIWTIVEKLLHGFWSLGSSILTHTRREREREVCHIFSRRQITSANGKYSLQMCVCVFFFFFQMLT